MSEEETEPIPVEMRERLQMMAALGALHLTMAHEIVETANDMLNQCIYDDLLLAIIDSDRTDPYRVYELFNRYCIKAGIAVPTKKGAEMIVLDHSLRQIVEPNSDPIREFCWLMDVLDIYEMMRRFEEFSEIYLIFDRAWEFHAEDSSSVPNHYHEDMRYMAAKLLARPDVQEGLAKAFDKTTFSNRTE